MCLNTWKWNAWSVSQPVRSMASIEWVYFGLNSFGQSTFRFVLICRKLKRKWEKALHNAGWMPPGQSYDTRKRTSQFSPLTRQSKISTNTPSNRRQNRFPLLNVTSIDHFRLHSRYMLPFKLYNSFLQPKVEIGVEEILEKPGSRIPSEYGLLPSLLRTGFALVDYDVWLMFVTYR